MILPLDSFRPLGTCCLQVVDKQVIIYGLEEVLIIRCLDNGEVSRTRVTCETHILRGHYTKGKLALITVDHKLTVYSSRDAENAWLPWRCKLYDLNNILCCYWLNQDELLLGFEDGTIDRFNIETKSRSNVLNSSSTPITFVSNDVSGNSFGDIVDTKNGETLLKGFFLKILDEQNGLSLISSFDTAFVFSGSRLLRQKKYEAEVIGGGFIANGEFNVCLKNGQTHCSTTKRLEVCREEQQCFGFHCGSSYEAFVLKKDSSFSLQLSAGFPTSASPCGLLYEACRLISCSQSSMSTATLAEELHCLLEELNQTVPLNDRELFEKRTDGSIKASKSLEHGFITGNRSIHLTETSYNALKHIAASGRDGLIQGELCKFLSIDHKTIFHHLKPLIKHNLIIRYPVTVNKTYTYILIHWSFTEEEYYPVNTDDNIGASCTAVREMILKLLRNHPNRALSSNQLFSQLTLNNRKTYQKAISTLACQGAIECFRGAEIGQRESIIRLKENSTATTSVEESSNDEGDEAEVNYASEHRVGLPFGFQLYQYIASCGEKGTTARNICEHFGLTLKASHRILNKVVGKPPFCDRIQKQAEFFGRERRFRFFIDRDPVNDAGEPKLHYSPVISTQSSGTSSVASRGDSVNRTVRVELLLKLLRENGGILEVSKSLASRMTLLLESKHDLDIKTLKRTVSILEEDGHVTSVTVSVGNTSKLIITLPDVVQSQIDDYVAQMKSQPRSQAIATVIPDETESSAEAEGEIQVEKYEHGFLFGSMLRARLLHHYLLSKGKDAGEVYKIDSMQVIFKEMPLKIYATLIGIERAEEKTIAALSSDLEALTPISNFKLNLKKLRAVVQKLLELLVEEDLVQGPLNLTIPLTLTLCKVIGDLHLPDDFEKLWEDMEESSHHPERWIPRQLGAKEKRDQRRAAALRTADLRPESLSTEDIEYLDSLLSSSAPSIPSSREPTPTKIYSDEEDERFMIAITVAFFFRARYSMMFSSAGKLPFKLLSLALFPEENERSQSAELRRRVKNFAHNSSDRVKLRGIDERICLIDRMVEAGLLKYLLNEQLSQILGSKAVDVVESGDEEAEESNEPDRDSKEKLMANEFEALNAWFIEKIDNFDALNEQITKHHQSQDKVDISRLKAVIPDGHVDLMSELETEYRTRTEAMDEYYSLRGNAKRLVGFSEEYAQFRKQLVAYDRSEEAKAVIMNVSDEILDVAVSSGLLVKSGKKKARFVINGRHFQLNRDAFVFPMDYTIPAVIDDMGQESPEGLLSMLASGDIIIDPETLSVTQTKQINANSIEDILRYTWLAGKWAIFSQEELNDFQKPKAV